MCHDRPFLADAEEIHAPNKETASTLMASLMDGSSLMDVSSLIGSRHQPCPYRPSLAEAEEIHAKNKEPNPRAEIG